VNCYDCAIQDRLARPAVAVCHDCGAAVCDAHAVARAHHLTRIGIILREEQVEPAARIVRCTTCDTRGRTSWRWYPWHLSPEMVTRVLGGQNDQPMTRYFPEVADALRPDSRPARCVVDGEMVVVADVGSNPTRRAFSPPPPPTSCG
jgi:hypothetical protein